MNRFHVHVSVDDLQQNIRFYSAMFGAPPTVEKPDYAKWMLEDPRVNFAISRRGAAAGLNHLGFQVETQDELQALRRRVDAAAIAARDETGAGCCYARSDKYWVQDPQGIAWETFHTLGEIPVFGGDAAPPQPARAGCCVPETPVSFAARPRQSGCC
ncbi:MAG TPA: ArsI/CadI family heavy metal resistance metalloenzyme [Nevskia sp.]|nr:ArsI/CadI family heavy metal resistance metalloenzyme [Nevskia sp.]